MQILHRTQRLVPPLRTPRSHYTDDHAQSQKTSKLLQGSFRKAFTLIELLVVLAITAILASFAVPAYQDYIRKTHVTEAISIAKHIWLQIADNALNGVPLSSGVVAPAPTPWYGIYPNYGGGHVDITFSPSKFNGQAYYMNLYTAVKTSSSLEYLSPGVIPDSSSGACPQQQILLGLQACPSNTSLTSVKPLTQQTAIRKSTQSKGLP